MNSDNINNLFELFANMKAECCQSFIVDAKRTVFHMARVGTEYEIRLDYLTAAIACLEWKRTQQIVQTHDKTDKCEIRFAEQLVNAYMALCVDLLNQKGAKSNEV